MDSAGSKSTDRSMRTLAKVRRMTSRFRGSTDPKHAKEIVDFMYDWLTSHVHENDKKYSSCLRGYEIE